jgi:HJR/Mrr/RecB family endonuclease
MTISPDYSLSCFILSLRHYLCTNACYHCIQTPIAGDGGIDIVAIKGSVGQLIQCKASTTNHSLGWDAVKEVVAGARAYEKQFPNVTFEKVAVTNQRFNNTAIGQAKLHDVLLIEGIELSLWLENYSVLLSFLQR